MGAADFCRSEQKLIEGDLDGAVCEARRSIEFATNNGNTLLKMIGHVALGDALHQTGRCAEAYTLFRDAEALQAESRSGHPLLNSEQGYRYCDLLLSGAERRVWRVVCKSGDPAIDGTAEKTHETARCREVEIRIKQVFGWHGPGTRLLDIALDSLTLGRAGLYRSLLAPTDPGHAQSIRDGINVAINVFRALDVHHFLLRGLLMRALQRWVHDDPSAAQADLNEVEYIAGSRLMRLFSADVHLHRGRLFKDTAELRKARGLIEQCGYRRRLGELEDAEEKAKEWE